MISRAEKERMMLEAVLAYQKDTAKISASLMRATKDAVEDLADDAEAIFRTFMRKGGFKSREEAQACMDRPITRDVRQRLIERAMRTYKGRKLKRVLVRLSSPSYKHRMTNADALKESAKIHGDALYEKAKALMTAGTTEVIREATARTEFEVAKEAGIAIDWAMPNEEQLEAVHSSIGVYDKVKLFSVEELEQARTRISEGILTGDQYDTIAERLSRDTNQSMYRCRRLVRTTMAQAAADADAKRMQEIGIKEYQISCVLDEKTCSICGAYDQKVYEFGKGPMPTFHPNCRCCISSVLPKDFVATHTRSARDGYGKKAESIQVPASMTYKEWREQYGPKTAPPEPSHKKAE